MSLDTSLPNMSSPNIYTLQVGDLYIVTDPPGATVYIDGSIRLETTLAIITGLPEGNHTYQLTLLGYKDITGIVMINDGRTSYIYQSFQPYISIGLQENVLLPALGLAIGIVAAEYIIRRYMSKNSTV